MHISLNYFLMFLKNIILHGKSPWKGRINKRLSGGKCTTHPEEITYPNPIEGEDQIEDMKSLVQ